MEQKRRSWEQMQRAKRKEAEFYKEKSRYFGITIADKDLVISVLDSLEAFQNRGKCPASLCLPMRILCQSGQLDTIGS